MGALGTATRFELTGQVHRPGMLTVAELRTRFPEHHADVVFECRTKGPQRHSFDGPLLRDVIGAAEPAFESGCRKERSHFLLKVSGTDGHHTVLSWAELDPDFGDSPVLLATAMDDVPLGETGPQLVVPTDRCGARYISSITRVWFGF